MDIATLIALGLTALFVTIPGAIKSRREYKTEELKAATVLCEQQNDCTLLRKKLGVKIVQVQQRIEIGDPSIKETSP